ncbi:hypothetical protein [Lentzea sp. NPDC051838]|uniref:hypothetical protein n=1 Tax=Lentzea sp. NPDC051838 TaxID=3154849 RepID=UPI0034415F27
MRVAIAGAAVLCLVAVQPASAAWQTSNQGNAAAKAVTASVPGGLTCVKSTGVISWTAVAGVPEYEVYWSDKDQGGQGTFTVVTGVTTTSYTVTGKVPLRAKIRSVAGPWTSTQSAEKICS